MTNLYQIQKTVNGVTTPGGAAFSQDMARMMLANLAGYMQRQGAQIVMQSTDSFTMSRAKVITKYDVVEMIG